MRTLCRYVVSLLLPLVLAGMVSAQDTNFARGPQYLMTNGSPLFAQPIATPTLSLPAPAPEIGAADSTAGLAAGAADETVTPRPPAPFDFFPIFYGRKWVHEIRMEATPEDVEVPPSLLGESIAQATTAEAPGQLGYGLTLAQAANQGKAQAQHSRRVYTNDDVERLRKGN
jgi:hypothetical protein